MPLRVTVELVPHGNEAQKRVLGVLNIINVGGAKDRPNYEVYEMLADRPGMASYSSRDVPRNMQNVFAFLKDLLVKGEKTNETI